MIIPPLNVPSKKPTEGALIIFEGPDGSGKTTFSRYFHEIIKESTLFPCKPWKTLLSNDTERESFLENHIRMIESQFRKKDPAYCMLLDRGYLSEKIYSKVFHRKSLEHLWYPIHGKFDVRVVILCKGSEENKGKDHGYTDEQWKEINRLYEEEIEHYVALEQGKSGVPEAFKFLGHTLFFHYDVEKHGNMLPAFFYRVVECIYQKITLRSDPLSSSTDNRKN